MLALRKWLSIPFLVAGFLAGLVTFSLFRHWLPRLLRWLSDGGITHVYWPLVRLQRRVKGVCLWQPEDLLFMGVQPRTPAAVELADKDERLVKLDCTCGAPFCVGTFYVPAAVVKDMKRRPPPPPPGPPAPVG